MYWLGVMGSVERTAHEHGDNQHSGDKNILKTFQNVRPLQRLDLHFFDPLPLFIESWESYCRLPENVQLIPSNYCFDAYPVRLHAYDVGRWFVDGYGQFLLRFINCHRAISFQPCNRLRGQVVFQHTEVVFPQAGQVDGTHKVQRHSNHNGQQEGHQAKLVFQHTF